MVIRNIKSAAEKEALRCEDLLCCIMGLSSSDAEIFSKLRRPMSLKSVMKATKKSHTRVQISLHKLVALGLLKRAPGRTTRGIKYIYSPTSAEQTKKILTKELNDSCRKLRAEIDKL